MNDLRREVDLLSAEELASRLEKVRDRAINDSETVRYDRAVGEQENRDIDQEQADTIAVIDEAIRRLASGLPRPV